ncbi:MAG: hypothetical protein AB7O04_09625 [Hyphomonadaceae bacterium]
MFAIAFLALRRYPRLRPRIGALSWPAARWVDFLMALALGLWCL